MLSLPRCLHIMDLPAHWSLLEPLLGGQEPSFCFVCVPRSPYPLHLPPSKQLEIGGYGSAFKLNFCS